jgi:hypothetical protein
VAKQHGLNLRPGLASFLGIGLRADAESRDGPRACTASENSAA